MNDVVGRLRVGRVARAALSLAGGAARPLSLIWLGMAAINFVGSGVAAATVGSAQTGVIHNLTDLAEAAGVAVLSMAAVRTMLGAPSVWRPDRGGRTFAAVDVASSLAIWLWYAVEPTLDATPAGLAGSAVWIAGGLAVWWVFIRIALWTYAQAIRERGMTIGASWRRMRGTAWAIVGSSTLLAILPNQAVEMLLRFFGPLFPGLGAWFAAAAIEALSSAAFSLMIVAVPAAVYRLRGGAGDDTVATVFD